MAHGPLVFNNEIKASTTCNIVVYICKVLQRRYNSLSFAISPIEALYIYIIYHNFPTAIQTISPT